MPGAPTFFTNNTIHTYQNKHLSISFTLFQGTDMDIRNTKHAVWELKGKFYEAFGVTCTCRKTIDNRSETDKQSCKADVSVALEEGETEIYEIFESNIIELEEYLFQMKGTEVCLTKGCIKMTAQVEHSDDFESLCDDIISGGMLKRMCSFLQQNNYTGYRGKPIGLILMVDNYQLQSIREYFIQEKDAGAGITYIYATWYNIVYGIYANDTQIYVTITPENVTTAIPEIQSCLESVQSWMDYSKLKLNPDKTEFIVFGSKVLCNKLSHIFPVNNIGNISSPSDKVRNLAVIFDSSCRFSSQVSSICSSSYYHIRDFSKIRSYLDKPTAIAVVNALVSSWLDCGWIGRNGLKLECSEIATLFGYSHLVCGCLEYDIN